MDTLARARRVTRGCALAGVLAGGGALAWAAPPSAASAPTQRVVAPGCHGDEDAAVSRLMARVRRERLYADWSRPGCLDFLVDAWRPFDRIHSEGHR